MVVVVVVVVVTPARSDIRRLPELVGVVRLRSELPQDSRTTSGSKALSLLGFTARPGEERPCDATCRPRALSSHWMPTACRLPYISGTRQPISPGEAEDAVVESQSMASPAVMPLCKPAVVSTSGASGTWVRMGVADPGGHVRSVLGTE